MDLETENRLAALLMEEARRLRVQADKEGVNVYLKPNVRGRPNSRFLTATVLGVQQANRAVEVNEMWRAREKERELEEKLKRKAKDKDVHHVENHYGDCRRRTMNSKREQTSRSSSIPSSSKAGHDDDTCYSSDDGGLRDDEMEEFLNSRTKRGRGAIGSRMDEPGPYPSSRSLHDDDKKLFTAPEVREKEEWECRVFGSDKPSFIKPHEQFSQEKIHHADSSKKKHSSKEKKRRSREERSERKKNKEKRKCKYHHRHKRRRSRSDSE